jgi:hypothetical protein
MLLKVLEAQAGAEMLDRCRRCAAPCCECWLIANFGMGFRIVVAAFRAGPHLNFDCSRLKITLSLK